MYKLGAIGMGNMGMAIIDGALKTGIFAASDVLCYDPNPSKAEICEKKGFAVAKQEVEVFQNCEILLLAILPQQYDVVLGKLQKGRAASGQVVMSIAAGISAQYIQSFLGSDAKIINVMPNTPLMIGIGATALARTANISDGELDSICKIYGAMGEVVVVEEKQLAEIVPANGSTPAYVYYFMDCIARSVEKRGVDKNLALRLIAKSFIGSAEMLLQTGKSPKELIDQVCSPGGLTIETINVFDERDLFSIIDEGCVKCVERGYELAK